jgi:hypothetical protein
VKERQNNLLVELVAWVDVLSYAIEVPYVLDTALGRMWVTPERDLLPCIPALAILSLWIESNQSKSLESKSIFLLSQESPVTPQSALQSAAICRNLPQSAAICRNLHRNLLIAIPTLYSSPLFTNPSTRTNRQFVSRNFSRALLGFDLVIASAGLSWPLIHRISCNSLRSYD